MDQYFEVGEEVFVQSKTQPQNNGEYVISHALGVISGDTYKCPSTGINVRMRGITTEQKYLLHGLNTTTEEGTVIPWLTRQSSLKKKYPKGESFDSLMETLNLGVTA